MKASILDLRYNMKEVIEALERREIVHLYHHDTFKGTIHPKKDKLSSRKIKEHKYFGSRSNRKESVLDMVAKVRDGRF